MLIAHVIEDLSMESGGPTRALLGLATGQARRGAAVRVITTAAAVAEPVSHQQLRHEGVDVRVIDQASNKLLATTTAKRDVQASLSDVDVIHVHGVWAGVLYRAVCTAQRLTIPYVLRPCGMLDRWAMRQKRVKKRVYYAFRLRTMVEQAHFVHFTTAMEARESQRWCPRASYRIEPNGVDFDEFAAGAMPVSGLRESWGVPQATPVVMFLGRVHPGKGVEYLIPAMRHVASPATLVVVGPDSGGHARRMQQLAADLGVANRVVFGGPLSGRDRVAALREAAVFCLPSDHENFGIAAIEAMAAGCPALVSRYVGIAEAIREAGAGDIVARDPPQLGATLQKWIVDSALRERSSIRAHAHARSTYDWGQIAARWLRHYEALCSGSAPAPVELQ